MKKIFKLLVSLMIISSALLPSMMLKAKAGVVSQFVEVDEDERKAAEAERIRAQEEYRQEARAQAEAQEAPEEVVQQEVPATPKVAEKREPVNLAPKSKHASDLIRKILGTIVAVPVGSVAGLVRGGVSKGGELAESFSDSMTSELAGNLVGKPGGVIVGGVSGAVAGLLNGAVTGATEGWENPFTKASFSLDGSVSDYDPFEF